MKYGRGIESHKLSHYGRNQCQFTKKRSRYDAIPMTTQSNRSSIRYFDQGQRSSNRRLNFNNHSRYDTQSIEHDVDSLEERMDNLSNKINDLILKEKG
jgi:hypothetical protein